VRGATPASIVYSDDRALAFMDIQPVNPGHVLVVPKTHAAQLSELDETIGGHLFRVAMRVTASLRRSGLKCEAVNLILADGEVAGQEIFHVHLHVVPRFKDDGFGFKFCSSYGLKPERKELDAIAEKIRDAMH